MEQVVSYIQSLLDPEPGASHSEADGADITKALEGLKAFNASLKNHFKGV